MANPIDSLRTKLARFVATNDLSVDEVNLLHALLSGRDTEVAPTEFVGTEFTVTAAEDHVII